MKYFAFICCLVGLNAIQPSSLDLTLNIGPISNGVTGLDSEQYTVYKDGILSDSFNIGHYSSQSCTPPPLITFIASNYNQTANALHRYQIPITITNDSPNQTYSLGATFVTNQYTNNNINSSIEYLTGYSYNSIKPKRQVTMNVIHQCSAQLTNFNYWSIINVKLNFEQTTINFQYQMLCNPKFNSSRFDYSYFILVAVYSIIVLILARFGKIRSFRLRVKPTYSNFNDKVTQKFQYFQGFPVNFVYSFIYVAVVAITLVIKIKTNPSPSKPVDLIFVLILSSILTYIYINETFCAFRNSFLKKRLFKFIRYCDVLSVLLTVLIYIAYFQYQKAWFISDILCAFALGSALKLLKITSLKDAVLTFTPCIIADLATTAVLRSLQHNWDVNMLLHSNNPLLAEIPYFNYIYQKKCAWLSVYSLLLPGLFIAYATRYGINKRTFVYTIVSFVGLFVGLLGWMFSSFSTGMTPQPMSLFSLIPMVSLCALLAYKRGEVQCFWTGVFFDEILLDPYKHDGPNNFDSKVSMEMTTTADPDLNGSQFIVTRQSGTYVVDQSLFQGIGPQAQTKQEIAI